MTRRTRRWLAKWTVFFLSKHKNFIPHTYPCRDDFRQHFAEKPQPFASANYSRWWFPFASDRVDLSGFWFRPTRVGAQARTLLDCPQAGEYRFRLATCGGALLKLNGEEVLWMADYQRNTENQREFSLSLQAGKNELELWFDDLAERDIRFFSSSTTSPVSRCVLRWQRRSPTRRSKKWSSYWTASPLNIRYITAAPFASSFLNPRRRTTACTSTCWGFYLAG